MNDTVYALADPMEVDVAAIERELEEIWRDAAKGADTDSVTRATAFNLVYLSTAADEKAPDMLAKLTIRHPSRSILLLLGDGSAASAQSAWVTAYCHRPNPTAPQICSEFISIEVHGAAVRHAASTLRSLALGGLPTVMIIGEDVPLDARVVIEYAPDCERVILSRLLMQENIGSLRACADRISDLPSSSGITSLQWNRVRRWMSLLAREYSSTAKSPASIKKIELNGISRELITEALLFSAWSSRMLKWRYLSHEKGSSQFSVHFHENNLLSISFSDGGPSRLRLYDSSHELLSVGLSEFQLSRDRVELLSDELSYWGSDDGFRQAISDLSLWFGEQAL